MTLEQIHRPRTPGVFVTGTGTEIGKTVVSCLIADQLRRRAHADGESRRIGVMKPLATGCRRERGSLVAEDAEQLAAAADFVTGAGEPAPLDVINPIRFVPPVAPSVAIEHAATQGESVEWLSADGNLDWSGVDRALRLLDGSCARLVIEGVGGALVPIEMDRGKPITVIDLARSIGYPCVVVADAALGTLNHTWLTIEALRRAGLTVAGVVLNRFDAHSTDLAMQTNPAWLKRLTGVPVLAAIPSAESWDASSIDPVLRNAIDQRSFWELCRGSTGGVRR